MNSYQSLEDAARQACESIGVDFKSVPADGRFHAADIADDHHGKNDGRIKIFPDRQGGIVWNFKSGQKQLFFLNNHNAGTSTTQEERQRIKAEQEKRRLEIKTKQDKAAHRARAIWQSAKPAPPDHPRLIRKRHKPFMARVGCWTRNIQDENGNRKKLVIDNCLLLPLYNERGNLRNIQGIFPEDSPELGRSKDFMPGAELSSMFSWIGEKTQDICLSEGFSTGATIHQETGCRTYIAYSANNLLNVARIIRRHLPDAKIIVCADNDKSGTGQKYANEAALVVDGLVAMPPILGMDFNDYAAHLQDANQ